MIIESKNKTKIQEILKEDDEQEKEHGKLLEKIDLEKNVEHEEVKVKKQRLHRVVLRNEHLTNLDKGLYSLYKQN